MRGGQRLWICFVGCFGLLAGCFQPSAQSGNKTASSLRPIIYGKDDRKEAAEHPDAKLRQLSAAVGALVSTTRVQIDSNTGAVTLTSTTLTEKVKASPDYDGKDLCKEEPFRDDPAPASCSVFLVGPRLVATAGHCISTAASLSESAAQAWCRSRVVLFGFAKNKEGKLPSLTEANVYKCSRVLLHKLTRSAPILDIGMFELDRDVSGIKPLEVDWNPKLSSDQPLAVMGYPNGVPLKIAAGGKVTNPRTQEGDYFVTNLDTLPGNSGSPVLSTQSYKVVGVHVRGDRPVYKIDTEADCNRSNVVPENPGKQAATYMKHGALKRCTQDSDCDTEQACVRELCSPKQPDLTVTSLKVTTASPLLGLPVNVQVEVKNIGTADVTQGFRVGLWWSPNTGICPGCGQDKEVAFLDVPNGLKAGESYTGAFGFKAVEPVQAGRQYVGAYVDDHNGAIPQPNGKVQESNEGNNFLSVALDVKRCESSCPKEGDVRCEGQRVDVCAKGTLGCLQWDVSEFCETPAVCQEGKCVKTCTDTCDTDGHAECNGNKVRECKLQPSGCLAWVEGQTCTTEEFCSNAQCLPIPKQKDGQSCKEDNDCQSKACGGTSTEKVCLRPCTSNSDCTGLTGHPFCDKGFCQPIPKGGCLTIRDCLPSQVCSANQCQPDPKQQGCGCSASSEPSGSMLFVGFLLVLLPLLRRFGLTQTH